MTDNRVALPRDAAWIISKGAGCYGPLAVFSLMGIVNVDAGLLFRRRQTLLGRG